MRKKKKAKINKLVYLGLSILGISKNHMSLSMVTLICYMDTDSCIIYIKAKDVYEDIANIIEIRFDTLNYEVNRPLKMKKKNKRKN